MAGKVALVTGANKGIGFAIVEELCKRGVGTVYLGSRDKARGEEAVNKLKAKNYSPLYLQLEVTDKNSVKAAAEHIKSKHGGLDILINNAGIISKDSDNPTYEDSVNVLNVNYRSFFIIKEYLYPILKDNARVINISSDCGHINNIGNEKWVKTLTKNDVTEAEVNAFVDWFLECVKTGNLSKEDFPIPSVVAYRVSKVAMTALTRIHQREIGRNISINAVHPGFVKTDLTHNAGFLTNEEAAKTPVDLALDAPQSLKGAYLWQGSKEYDWTDTSFDLQGHFKNIMDKIMSGYAS